MNNKKTIFSIVVPAYNEEKYIKKCIRSLQKQGTSYIYEIIVVNNNSTDKTDQIAQEMAVKVVQEKKQGVGAARRRGTEIANGKYVLHIDADTQLPSNFLEEVEKLFQANPKVVCLGGQYVFYDAVLWKQVLRMPLFYLLLYFARLFSNGRIGPMGGCLVFINKIYKKTNGFNADLKFGEDSDLCRQLSYFGQVKVYPHLKCYVSVRRFKINSKLIKLFFQYLKMVFNRKANYNFPHSKEL